MDLGIVYTFYIQELETIDAEGLFRPAYTIEIPGTVALTLTVDGTQETHTYELIRNVSESRVKIDSITPKWEEGQLMGVEYTMKNMGGVPADISVDVRVTGTNSDRMISKSQQERQRKER